ncbi:stage II sporulation protein R [Robertmurraya sp. FSL W8-0741]|uniref:stage II sporulation protein R n=1 Tax=Robertmurraya TaxID=2837507 RepID=UPI000BA7E3D0|nr:stage II sporulation protein R [Robertmurraya siralis]PAE19649.1 stage II sporulation protein R [Bacillus sp. 7504-2]
MKAKTVAMAYILILSIGTIFSLYIPKNEVTANDLVVIPNEAIRLRILANSDHEKDQEMKRKVRDAINAEITAWVEDLTSVEAARRLIESRMPDIQKIAENVVRDNGSTDKVEAAYDKKVEFPTKLYGEFLYPAGEYEAILVTIGEGQGANWWCVLFPPLCFLDFSNSVAVSEGIDEESVEVEQENQENQEEPLFVEDEEEEVKVKFFLVEIFEKIFG